MEKHLEKALRQVVTFLESHKYRYALIGGIALAQWGVVRATYDVDIKLLVPDNDYAGMAQILQSAFAENTQSPRPPNPLIVSVSVNEVIIDFLLALPGYEELIIERAVQRDFGGWSAWISSAEDLIIQKAVAGRGKDWLDVETLLIEQRGQLDETYIKNWLTQFVEALDKPEILTTYQQLLERVDK